MIRFTGLLRNHGVNSSKTLVQKCITRASSTKKSSSSSSSSGSSSSSEDELKKLQQKTKSAEARNKLSLLLDKMIQDDLATSKQDTLKLELAKPRSQRQKDVRTEPGTKSVKSEPVEKMVVKAVKDVAESIGGDVKQTESELLQKLLNPVNQQPTQTTTNLNDIFKDMKIDRETKAGEQVSRAQQVRQLLHANKARQQQTRHPKADTPRPPRRSSIREDYGETNIVEDRVDLFGSDRLGIFPSLQEVDKWEDLQFNKTWKALQEKELRLASTHPPTNYFQQMIQWTEQGKLWKFPIDNEQDLEEEKKVYFAEHVFLERHLDAWCPQKGPLRHFMELVCVGLSKNCYLSVQQKKEHIEWFRNYFGEKQQLLREVGAVPPDFEVGNNVKEKIEG